MVKTQLLRKKNKKTTFDVVETKELSLEEIELEKRKVDYDLKEKKIEAKKIKNSRKDKISQESNSYKIMISFYKKNLTRKTKRDNFKLYKLLDKKVNLWKKIYRERFKEGNQPNSKGNLIDVSNLSKYYVTSGNYEQILKDITFNIKEGTMTTILGPSGTGKSTLLNIISGLLTFSSGDVIVAGKNLFYLNEEKRTKFRKENISFVFQNYNLISTLTVKENVLIGYDLRRREDNEISIEKILEALDLKSIENKHPYQLSGGQQQRVSIGRALAKNPKILFADEPTGALDEERGRETLQLLIDINKKFNTTIIIVTHAKSVSELTDYVIKIKNGQIQEFKKNLKKKQVSEIKWG